MTPAEAKARLMDLANQPGPFAGALSGHHRALAATGAALVAGVLVGRAATGRIGRRLVGMALRDPKLLLTAAPVIWSWFRPPPPPSA